MIELFMSAAAVFLLDQMSKRLVESRLSDGSVTFGPLLRIRLVANSRRQYASDAGRTISVLVWIAALASAVILIQSGAGFQSRSALIGVGAALGGAAGNLSDILRSRSVKDFIDLGWWPVFNLADVAILGGLALALIQR